MVKLGLFGAGIGDLAHSVQDGGVVSSTEQVADLRQALLSQLPGQYIATWRGRAILAGRRFEYMSATLIL